MTLQRPILTSFNGGEISPRMNGRVDTAIYGIAAETLENFVPTVEGPITKRPGFEYITPADDSAAWLGTFKFNITQDYVIEWCDYKIRFYANGVRLETAPGVPYEVAVPYTAAEAKRVSFQQSYDRLYLDHSNHPPARLTRTGAATFVYEVIALQNGPFGDRNSDQTITVSAAVAGGVTTLTASAAIFAPGHVGAPFQIEPQDFASIPAWQVGIDGVAIGDMRRNEGKVYRAQTAGRTGTVAPTHTEGSAWDGSPGKDVSDNGPYGILWQYAFDRYGVVQITGYVSPVKVTGMQIRPIASDVFTTPTWRWTHALFSAAAGWPGLVKTWKSRLIHVKLFDMAASVVGDYLNHSKFTDTGLATADLAFREVIATDDPPLWIAGDRKLLIGTASRELAIGPASQGALSGSNIDVDDQSFYGSNPVFPLQAGTSTFFVQRAGRKMREAQYDFTPDRYVATNSTVWARHITKSGIVQLAFQKEPEEILLAVRGDGQLIVHPHQPEQEVKGLARIVHSNGLAQILSVVSISSTDGQRDEVWALIERNGAKSVERMADWRDDDDPIEDAFFVDSGVRGTAAANQVHFSGLTHLAGMTVAVLAAGGVISGLVVTGTGELTLPAEALPLDQAYSYAIGLPYTATCVTLPPELKINGETSQGKRQRLVRLALRLLGTLGINVGSKGGRLDNLIDRPTDADMDAAIPLFSGDSGKAVSGNYDTKGQAMFISSDPLPATVTAVMPLVEVEPAKT